MLTDYKEDDYKGYHIIGRSRTNGFDWVITKEDFRCNNSGTTIAGDILRGIRHTIQDAKDWIDTCIRLNYI